jgi:GNAT superfamily N-acetyltransferase
VPAYHPTPVDVRAMDDVTAAAHNDLFNRIRAERIQGSEPIAVATTRTVWSSVPDFVEPHGWGIWDGVTLIGLAVGLLSRYEQNSHLVVADIAVRPEFRRRGLGRRLLVPVVDLGLREGRTTLQMTARVPAGAAFAEHVGLRQAMTSVTNRLPLDQAHVAGLRDRLAPRPTTAGEFVLDEIVGSCPLDQLDEVATAWHLLNDAPNDDLSYEDDLLTAAQLHEFDDHRAAAGIEQLTVMVREQHSRRIVSFAHFVWNSGVPDVVHQDGLAVDRNYRGLGLAGWLEAAGVTRVAELWPEASQIRTDQAKSNTDTLNLFYRIGFVPIQEFSEWEGPLADIRDRLAVVESSAVRGE